MNNLIPTLVAPLDNFIDIEDIQPIHVQLGSFIKTNIVNNIDQARLNRTFSEGKQVENNNSIEYTYNKVAEEILNIREIDDKQQEHIINELYKIGIDFNTVEDFLTQVRNKGEVKIGTIFLSSKDNNNIITVFQLRNYLITNQDIISNVYRSKEEIIKMQPDDIFKYYFEGNMEVTYVNDKKVLNDYYKQLIKNDYIMMKKELYKNKNILSKQLTLNILKKLKTSKNVKSILYYNKFLTSITLTSSNPAIVELDKGVKKFKYVRIITDEGIPYLQVKDEKLRYLIPPDLLGEYMERTRSTIIIKHSTLDLVFNSNLNPYTLLPYNSDNDKLIMNKINIKNLTNFKIN